MALALIKEMVITPSVVTNGSEMAFACVITDQDGVILTAGVTATVILTRSDGTALAMSPVTLSYSAGKWRGQGTLTGQAGLGQCMAVFRAVYSTKTTDSVPQYFEIIPVR